MKEEVNVSIYDMEGKNAEKLSEADEALLRDSEPMWLTDQFINRPCTSIGIGMLTLFVLTGVAVMLDYFALTPANTREYLIFSDPRTYAWDMKILAEEFILTNAGSEGA
jgi:hypothetical protein